MIRQIFNEVLNEDECTPETWRRIRIKVIFFGDVEEIGNYCPIYTLPALTNCSQQTHTTDYWMFLD